MIPAGPPPTTQQLVLNVFIEASADETHQCALRLPTNSTLRYALSMVAASEMIDEGRGCIGRNGNAHHALKRLIVTWQSQRLGGLTRISARNLDVHADLNLAALETPHER